jgi:carbon storage regulator CsrA
MLVLSRKEQQRVRLKAADGTIIGWVTVVDIDRGKIRLGFDMPATVEISREEILPESEHFRHPPYLGEVHVQNSPTVK